MNTVTRTWTDEAQNYLEGYLLQVAALLAGQGADASEVIGDLRDHIIRLADTQAGSLVTVPDVKRFLGTVGTLEDVAASWGQLGDKIDGQDPWAAPHLNPPQAATPRGRRLEMMIVLGIAGGFFFLVLPLLYALSHSGGTRPATRSGGVSARPEVPPTPDSVGRLLNGWFQAGTNHADYVTGTQARVPGFGSDAMFIRSTAEAPPGFSTVMRELPADQYRGKHVVLRGNVRADHIGGWAGMWLRIDGPDKKPLGFDNMQDRPITGTQKTQTYTIPMDVPADAQAFAYGVLLTGTGEVWFDDLRLEQLTPAK